MSNDGWQSFQLRPETVRAVLERGATRRVFNTVQGGVIETPPIEPKYHGWYCLTEYDAEGRASHSWHAIGIDPDAIDLDPNMAWLHGRIAALRAEIDALTAAVEVQKRGHAAHLRFKTEFLERERAPEETLKQADERLLADWEELEARRPLSADEDARRRDLFENFYEYRG